MKKYRAVLILLLLLSILFPGCSKSEADNNINTENDVITGDSTDSTLAIIEETQNSGELILPQVLQNQSLFYSLSNDKSMTLEEYCVTLSEHMGFAISITQYTFVDMDNDGTQEAIVDFSFGENSQVMCMVLKWDSRSEIVYGMEFYYRQMSHIKEDGTFSYSSGASNHGIARLDFTGSGFEYVVICCVEETDSVTSYHLNGETITESEFWEHFETQSKKNDVSWNSYSETDKETQSVSPTEYDVEKSSVPTYVFPVRVSENRELSVCLRLKHSDEYYTSEILEVQIYDGDLLLQTITKDDIPEVRDYAWDGLYFDEDSQIGMPDIRDLNFDGTEDFGLLAVSTYPQNVPYSYFFWNAEKEIFEYYFTSLGPGWLQIDDSEKRLVEISNEGTKTYKKYFMFTPNGSLAQEEPPFDSSPVTIDGYVYGGGNGSDGMANRVSVTLSIASVICGQDAYNYLLLSDPALEAPGPGQEYIVIIMNIKYDDGDLNELDMAENIARQPSYSLHFALSNESSNAIDVTNSLFDPIYNIRLPKGGIASGSVAFLHEVGNTQPLCFYGFDEITTFEIHNWNAHK